jgi:hypothetical protein
MHFKRWNREEEDREDTRYIIIAKSGQYGEKRVEYRRSETSEVFIRFQAGASLEITVAGYVGSGCEEKITLRLRKEEDREDGSFSFAYSPDEKVNPEGRQTFGPVEPGAYVIVVGIKTGRYQSLPVEFVPVTLRAGKNRATVNVPSLYSLTVIAEDVDPGRTFRLRPELRTSGWWGIEKKVGPDRRALFEDLPAGTYKLALSGDEMSGEMQVTVPDQAVVRFEPKPQDAMSVTITDPEGAMAKAGLLTGDLLIGIDGTEFKSMPQMVALLGGAMGKSEM